MSEKILEFTTPDNKAEGETNKAEQGIVYPPEIKAKLDQSLASLSKAEKGSAEELIALQAYQEEINLLTKAREEKEAKEALVDFKGEQIHKFELEALEDLILQINKGFAQQRIINKDFKAENISLDDLKIIIEDNKVIQIRSNTTVLSGDISKAIEALISLKYLGLRSLSSAEGLILPTTLNGNLDLHNLSSAEGLTLPTILNGYLDLSNLKSAEGLTPPTILNGGLDLSNLKSAEGLILPSTLNGSLYIPSLSSAERNALRKKHPSFKILPLG
ncbi:hypothetical protein KBC40_01235 [Patescibacteria group bacterium]|nr:hypothetical protein [Patescibacteria group bacterium]